MIEVVTFYFEETNVYKKAPISRKIVKQKISLWDGLTTLPSIEGYTNM